MTMRAGSSRERLGPTTQTYAIALMQNVRINEARGEHRQAAHAARTAIASSMRSTHHSNVVSGEQAGRDVVGTWATPTTCGFPIALRMFRRHGARVSARRCRHSDRPRTAPGGSATRRSGQAAGRRRTAVPRLPRRSVTVLAACPTRLPSTPARRELGSVFDELRHVPISLDAAVSIAEAWLDRGDQLPQRSTGWGSARGEVDVLRLLASGLLRPPDRRAPRHRRPTKLARNAPAQARRARGRLDAAAWVHQHLPLD